MRETIHINEVGLRDGLQNQPRVLTTKQKLTLVAALSDAGVRSFEAASFVSPRAVPQMADAETLFAQLPEPARISYEALVPNMRGYARARSAGVRAISVVLGATDTFNRRNLNMSLDSTFQTCLEVIAAARHDGVRARAYISMATACPYEGATPPDVVFDLTARMFAGGADEVIIADSIGAGTPAQIEGLFRPLVRDHGANRLAAHFHDTRGMGLAMAWAAIGCGIRSFDASIGGLGGCPFAPGATGNLATEDLVFMLNQSDFETGIDVGGLLTAVQLAEDMLRTSLGGTIARWQRASTAKHEDEKHHVAR